MPDMYNPPDLTPYKDVQRAFVARNVMSQRSAGRKMSQPVTVQRPVISLPGNADGWMQMVVSGQTLKNEANYTPSTWLGWEKTIYGVTVSGGNLVFTADGSHYMTASLTMALKPSTNYLLLYDVISTSVSSAFAIMSNSSNGAFPWTSLGKALRTNKKILTTVSSISVNKLIIGLDNVAEPSGNSLAITNVRLYEVPVGSQIETDANNLTADQLAIKYPYIQGGALRDMQSQRLKSVGKNLEKVNYISAASGQRIYGALVKVNPALPLYGRQILNTTGRSIAKIYNANMVEITTGSPFGAGFYYDGACWMRSIDRTGSDTFSISAGQNVTYITYGIYISAGTLSAENRMISQIDNIYEPYAETVVYVPGPLRSLPNGVRDTVGAKRVSCQRSPEMAGRIITDNVVRTYPPYRQGVEC